METTSTNRKLPGDDQPTSNLETHLGYWLRLVSNEVSGAFARALQQHHISVAEWVALNQIATWTAPTSARLAVEMGMTRGAVSKILDKLESKNLISRATSQIDSRVQLLTLTGKARRALPSLTNIADSNDKHFFEVLGTDEQALLRRLLRDLAHAHGMRRIPIT
jgi:DNA-binding MarR family transcriptional regulator